MPLEQRDILYGEALKAARRMARGEPVTTYEDAKAQDTAAFGRFFHAMLDGGVHLPPSSFESWFVSGAHDEAAVQVILDALPAAARAAASA